MAISLTEVIKLAASILNASPETYGIIDDDLHPSEELQAAALNADRQIIATILDTPGHRARKKFATKININDGDIITDGFEGGVLTDGRAGIPVTPGALSRLKRNINNLTTTQGYYCIDGGIFHFTGTSAQIEVIQYNPSGSLSAPDEYIMGVVTGLLAQVFPKEGEPELVGAAGHFANLFNQALQLIRQGATSIPAPTPFKTPT
ncbi:MAG: hypothetical protein AB1489_12040 [Acidobacteriota bacterium]